MQKCRPMAESHRRGIPQSAVDQTTDSGMEIVSLRMQGADQLDPVRFQFIEALARRVRQQQQDVQRILDGRLREALAAYRENLEQTQNDARETIARTREQNAAAADDLQRLFSAGDFTGVRRFVARLEKNEAQVSLADLTRHIAQNSPEDMLGGPAEDIGSRCELKTMRCFRNTWSKLSVDRQVAQAIEHAPENAGPLNSHMLVLRSLALMRDISPDYLNRFVSYVDTLLWLDQADRKNRPLVKKPVTTKTPSNSGTA
jgi:hypothetical protein